MRIKIVGSSVDGPSGQAGRQFAATYVIDGCVAVDAGCLGFLNSVAEQRMVKHVLLTHSHLDHIASLPIFLDNVYERGPNCPTVYASESVRTTLTRDIFNESVWPDLDRLSQEESPFYRLRSLDAEETIEVEHLRITPVPLNHVVPTFGFLIEDSNSTIAIVSDTSPTERVWELARARTNLKAVFLEAAFPNSMAWLAFKAGHLTPELLRVEVAKLGRDVPVIAVHLKAAFHDEIHRDLAALGLSGLMASRSNGLYEF